MMLRIGELAELAGVSTRTIRHYHHIGLLPEPARRSNGYRVYGPRDAVMLLRARRLTELEHTLGPDHPGIGRERLLLEAMAHAAGPGEADLMAGYRQALADPDLVRRMTEAANRFEELADRAPSDHAA